MRWKLLLVLIAIGTAEEETCEEDKMMMKSVKQILAKVRSGPCKWG